MTMKYRMEKEAAEAAGREPKQPDVREALHCHILSYHPD